MRGLFCAALLAATLTAQVVPSYKTLKYPPLREIKIPNVQTFTLANGIKLYLLEDHELPTVQGFALLRTGNLFDPKDKVGLATVTGTVMRSGGTRAKTGDQLDVQLENIAASVETQIGETNGEVRFSALKNSADEVLGVFHDVLTQPEFRDDKIELAKTQYRSAISRRNDEASEVAQREFTDLVYGNDTPYGWQIEYETLDRIHRADVQAFYQRYFFPANTIIAVSGDFTAAEMHAKLERLFSDWTVKRQRVPAFPPVDQTSHPGIFLAVKSNVTQTNFMLGELGGKLSDKDFPALAVMSDILGGGFRSRLVKKVRTDLGYAYNIYADWAANYDHPGLFMIGGSTKSASTTEAVKAALGELNKMRTQEVTRDELDSARQSVLNSFVFNFDTPSKTLNRLVIYDYYGYPKDFIYQYRKGVEAVTTADVLRVAKDRIDPKLMAIVAVGNPKEFGEPLTSLGPVKDLDITIPEPKSMSSTGAAAPPANPQSIAQGRAILAQMQTAAGGLERLMAIKDVRETLNMQFEATAGGMRAAQTNYWLLPDTFRQENNLPFGKVIAYGNGQTGWLHSPQGTMPMAGPQLKQIQGEIFRGYIGLLASDHDPNRTVSLSAANTVTIANRQGESVDVRIDPATKLIASESFIQIQPTGPPSTVTIMLSDYRDVDGLKMPFKYVLSQGDKKMAEAVVSEYKFNSGLKPEDMAKQQ